MKKIFGIMAIGSMMFAGIMTTLAATSCAAIPQDIQNAWSTLTPDTQQYYVGQYCSGNSNVSTGSNVSTAGATINTQIQNPIKYSTFSSFAAAVTKTAVQVLMPFVVLGFMYAGFLFIKAQGNPKELEAAKAAITWSMIGAFILLGAWGFAQIIGQTISTITQ